SSSSTRRGFARRRGSRIDVSASGRYGVLPVKRGFLRMLQRAGLIGPAFRVWETIVSLRGRSVEAPDGPALPPRRLMVRVAMTADADWFLRSGRAAYDAIAGHVPLADVESVLDFGCGCGRVTRWFDGFE